jgi:TATA-box binding protein (TBP) (component of TFIID and TFIIIB)
MQYSSRPPTGIIIIIIIISKRTTMSGRRQIFLHGSRNNEFMSVGNIKFSFKLKRPLTREEFLSLRRRDGCKRKGRPLAFVVVRSQDRPFVFTYFDSGHVNVTGVADFDLIADAVFEALLNVSRRPSDIREGPDGQPIQVDNVQGTGSFGKRLNLLSLAESMREAGKGPENFTYRPDRFHGMQLRRPGAPGGLILFESGKFTIVGVPDVSEAAKLWVHVKLLVNSALAEEGASPLPEVCTPLQERKADEDRTPPGAPNVVVAAVSAGGGESEEPGRHVARKRALKPIRRFWLDESVDEDKENQEDGGGEEEYRHKKFRAAPVAAEQMQQ